MNTFVFKGVSVNVYNDGGSIPANFVDNNGLSSITRISGDRIEFPRGGGRLIYHVIGVNYDQLTGGNRVQAQKVFLNTLSDGSEEVVLRQDVGYSVDEAYFNALAQMSSLPNSTMLKTLSMHFINGLLARVPELGGDDKGRGVELFNNDGTLDTPLFTYKRTDDPSPVIEVVPIVDPVDYRLLVDGVEYLNVQEMLDGTTLTEKTLVVAGLAPGFHQFEYQELDGTGTLVLSQVRNILI